MILDEPTSGLDPGQVAGIRSFIQNLASDRTVVLSTHILAEVEVLCPRVIMIAGGRVVADGEMEQIRAHAGGGVRYRVEVMAKEVTDAQVATRMGALPEVEQVRPQPSVDGFSVLLVYSDTDPRVSIAALSAAEGWSLRAMERVLPRLSLIHI